MMKSLGRREAKGRRKPRRRRRKSFEIWSGSVETAEEKKDLGIEGGKQGAGERGREGRKEVEKGRRTWEEKKMER